MLWLHEEHLEAVITVYVYEGACVVLLYMCVKYPCNAESSFAVHVQFLVPKYLVVTATLTKKEKKNLHAFIEHYCCKCNFDGVVYSRVMQNCS